MPNFDSMNWRLEIVSKFYIPIFFTFREISVTAEPGQVGLGRFIVLNDSASFKIAIKMYLVEATHIRLLINRNFVRSLTRNDLIG